ncbi:hypothetical protein H9P43_008527 [Blastocladiella emersonii ATCC 22665]|nr:hypothetical protein H9P43_008527 [Blastocladiella emersonii ATCC 22665]
MAVDNSGTDGLEIGDSDGGNPDLSNVSASMLDEFAEDWELNGKQAVYDMAGAATSAANAEYLRKTNEYLYTRDAIGQGAHGAVYMAAPKTAFGNTRVAYACKIIVKNPDSGTTGIFDREISVMRRVNQPNLVKLHNYADSSIKSCLYMELVFGGNLLGCLDENDWRISEHRAQHVTRQLVDALGYLHSNDITHCNVKPENVLVRGGDNDDPTMPFVLLTNYGFAKKRIAQNRDAHFFARCGTDTYMAPELRLPELANQRPTMEPCKVDAWIMADLRCAGLAENLSGAPVPSTSAVPIRSLLSPSSPTTALAASATLGGAAKFERSAALSTVSL